MIKIIESNNGTVQDFVTLTYKVDYKKLSNIISSEISSKNIYYDNDSISINIDDNRVRIIVDYNVYSKDGMFAILYNGKFYRHCTDIDELISTVKSLFNI